MENIPKEGNGMIKIVKYIQTIFGKHVDKFAHLGISCLIYLIIYAFTRNELFAVVMTFLIGMAKEILDYVFYHAEIWDIITNIAGIASAVYLVRIILAG